MTSQNYPPALRKKLTEKESELRRLEKERGIAQWYIEQVLALKQHYQFRLHKIFTILNKHKSFPDTDPHAALSPLVPLPESRALPQHQDQSESKPWTPEEWEEMWTLLLLPIPDIALTKAQQVICPNTGDIDITSEQRKKQTTSHGEMHISSQAVHDLVKACQEQISKFYHAQFPKHMPQTIKLGELYYLALLPCCDMEICFEQGQEKRNFFFPQTHRKVRVQLDYSAGSQIICE